MPNDDQGGIRALRQGRSPSKWSLPGRLGRLGAQEMKILLRCWVATWVAALLIFIQPALVRIGQATFFAAVFLLIVPPAGILPVYLLATLSILLAVCIAWCWGLLTMKAALAARPGAETQSMIQELQRQAVENSRQSGETVQWEATKLVHDGFMLDARVTTVFYVMECVFVYALARLRGWNRKLSSAQLFATIVTTIFVAYGPSLPSFDGNLCAVLVKPGAIGVGLGTACCVLFFPKSASSVALDKMESLNSLLTTSLDSTYRSLAGHEVQLELLKATQIKIVSTDKDIKSVLAFFPLDTSRGRWGTDDIKTLHSLAREAALSSLSLLGLQIEWIRYKQGHETETPVGGHRQDDGFEVDSDDHEDGQEMDLVVALRRPEKAAGDARVFETLRQPASEVLTDCLRSLAILGRTMHQVNYTRWSTGPAGRDPGDMVLELQEALAALRSSAASCPGGTYRAVMHEYGQLFEKDAGLSGASRSASLDNIALILILEQHILDLSSRVMRLMEYTVTLYQAQPKARLWFPSKLREAISWLGSNRASTPSAGTSSDELSWDASTGADPDVVAEQTRQAHEELRRVRGTRGLSARRPWASRATIAAVWWLSNPAGMYALRMVIVLVATAIPSAIPSSAGFFYRAKLIWTVITALTCVDEYMATFTFALVSRAAATIVGGVMGMAAWYIGSGGGRGNPYGMAAITAVMIVVLVWWRIFLPPAYNKATILTGTTFCLVVGYSYDQYHLGQQYGLPGIGYEAFWKRVVAVLVGFAAASIVQILPRPPTATDTVRKTLANVVDTVSDLHALLLSAMRDPTPSNGALSGVAQDVSLAVADRLLSLDSVIPKLRLEFTLGPFDRHVLGDTRELCQHMNQALRRLFEVSTSLPRGLHDSLARTTGLLDGRLTGDVAVVLEIAEQSLRSGSPLGENLPTSLTRRFFELWHARGSHARLTAERVQDEDYRQLCITVSAYLDFLSAADELMLVLKARLGESHVTRPREHA